MNNFNNLFITKLNLYHDEVNSLSSTLGQEETIKYLETKRAPILAEMLQYANENPSKFKSEILALLKSEDNLIICHVVEALSKDSENWDTFLIEMVDYIYDEANKAENPQPILENLSYFSFIELEKKLYVQKIADRIYKELNNEKIKIQLASIWVLPFFIENEIIKNKSTMLNSLQDKLYDKNWQVRYVAYTSLGYAKMIPAGFKYSLLDRIRGLFEEKPMII